MICSPSCYTISELMSMRLKDIVFLFAILVFSNILATAAGESESQPPRVQRVSREDEDSGVRRSERVLSDRTERRVSDELSRNFSGTNWQSLG